MTTLFFHNPGQIDIRGATIAGLSAKSSTSAIGFFGTGLKYGIAAVLRLDGQVTIWSGNERYQFHTQDLDFRGQPFKQITITGRDYNNHPLGFTTEYGKQWQPWQIFRELYANALDEGGGCTLDHRPPTAGTTLLEITCPQLLPCYHERDAIILPPSTAWDFQSADVNVAIRQSPSLYYKGVRVADLGSPFTINLLRGCELTEDRTAKGTYVFARSASRAIMLSSSEALIGKALMLITAESAGALCQSMSVQSWDDHSPEFLSVARRLYKQNRRRYRMLEEFIRDLAPEDVEPPTLTLTPIQSIQFTKALGYCRRMGMDPTDLDIAVAELGGGVLGTYNNSTGAIRLSPEVFRQGTKQVVSTLYEELVHHHTGKADCNYDMQTYLFNTIISLYEEHVFQEPI